MSYDFDEHRHRFAVWTAARAVQRSFTTTDYISMAIRYANLKEICHFPNEWTQSYFDEQHKIWAKKLISSFAGNNVPCSYGRAAKIISIYIKTSIVLPSRGEDELAKVAHPPVDGILLRELSGDESLKGLKLKRWTNFSQADYWEVVDKIRHANLPFNWRLEAFWKPEKGLKE